MDDRRAPRARLLGAVLLLLLPSAAFAASPWHADAYLLFLALPPTLGGFLLAPRAAWLGAGLAAAATVVGTAVSPWPWAGALVMALACAAVARGSRSGALLMGTTAATPLALALVSPPAPAALGITAGGPVTPERVLVAGALVAVGGAWAALVLTTAGRGVSAPRPPGESARGARLYAVVLVPLMAAATYVCMRWFPDSHAWWVLLTVLVVLHPRYDRLRSRAGARVAGTLAGGFAAALLVAVVPDTRVLTVLGVLCALAAAWANLARPYAQYAALLTLTVILLTSSTGEAFATDLARVGLTVLGAGLVLAVVVPGRALLDRQAAAGAGARRAPGPGR
ncbi:FUSC family protein [Cellulomonas sp. ACRRI]|uniref:FUSC family protein n=1 Tax=Cellulomonas sp. ACRRI TaxID=2918188 RepID=UPI001EF3B1E0|nr:FUSC family protein [Cellulomonas sp. ACRRI]MCG7285671.1 FUSC family protein [Cellulomonas sp. ACRRI]